MELPAAEAVDIPPAFRLEQFRDYLALEAGSSRHTVESYLRDVRRLATSALYYGTLTFLITTLGTNFDAVSRVLARANLVLGVVAVVLILLFVRWSYRRLKQ